MVLEHVGETFDLPFVVAQNVRLHTVLLLRTQNSSAFWYVSVSLSASVAFTSMTSAWSSRMAMVYPTSVPFS